MQVPVYKCTARSRHMSRPSLQCLSPFCRQATFPSKKEKNWQTCRKKLSKLKETEKPVPLRENVCMASVACPSVRSRVQDLLICMCGHKIFARGRLMAPTCSHMPVMLMSSLSSYRSKTHTSAFPQLPILAVVSGGKL